MANKKVKQATTPSKPKKVTKPSKKKTTTSKKKATTPKKKSVGRPPKYTEADKLQKKIDEYFAECDRKHKPYTITGLAMACDLTRQQLINYSDKEEFASIIRKAKMKVELSLEESLLDPYAKNITGIIFNLKNNYQWKDETSNNTNININDTKIIGKDGIEIEIPD